LDYLSLQEAAAAPLEFEDSESDNDELIEGSVGEISSEGYVEPIKTKEKVKDDVALSDLKTMEGLEDLEVKGAFGGEEEIVPHINRGEIPLEEIPVSSVSISPAHYFLELTLGDFGVSEPFSNELIGEEMTKSIHEMVEKVTTSLAPPIVERVVREIALKRSEEIIKEEIARIKEMNSPSPV
jgi:hypothetical protein